MILFNFIYRLLDKLGAMLNIIILSPNYRSFGNCSEAIYFGLLHCMDRNKKMLIIKPFNQFFFKNISIANRSLYQLQHELIIKPSFLFNFLLSLLMTVLAGSCFFYIKFRINFAKAFNLPKFMQVDNKELSELATQKFGWNDIWEVSEDISYVEKRWIDLEKKYVPPDLPEHVKKSSNQFIKQNIPEAINKKWVTLHSIDNTINDNARGANIDEYFLAVEYLISRGFHIFRIGDKRLPRCKEIKGLTDLAHLNHDNSLDLYLIQNAEFHFGVSSGPKWIGYLFNKDVFSSNIVDWSTDIPRKKGNFFIMKTFFTKSTNKKIPISMLLEHDFGFQINTNSIGNRDLYVKDNSGLEILEALKEFLQFKEGNKDYTAAQKKFDKKKNLWLKEELGRTDLVVEYWPSSTYNLHRKRSFAMSTVSGTMSNTFLNENW
jgi:putative glycosyltransferase (TIGR04372 family)